MAQAGMEVTSTTAAGQAGFVEVEGGRLFCEIAGQGPTMVFLHDGLLHRETWNHQYSFFADRFRVVRYDRRGYGNSSKPDAPYSDIDDLYRLMVDLGLQDAILIGCSAGSRLAIDFTLAHPHLVSALVLADPVVSGYALSEHYLTRGGRVSMALYQDQDAFRDYWLTDDQYTIYADNAEAKAEAVALLKANPHNMSFDNFRFGRRPERPAINALGEIAVPTLVIVGEHDIADIHAHTGVIETGIPDARRAIINNACHLAHFEKPVEFNKLVLNFLLETEFWTISRVQGLNAAIESLKNSGNLTPELFPFTEGRINQLGYEYLQAGNIADALQMFKLNATVFPNSWNAYDSYAEALLVKGDTTGAIQNYTRALELNPNNANAARIVEELGGK